MNLRLVSIAVATFISAPAAAFACGGLFCAAPPPVPSPPEPVDQTAERIVFEVDEDRGEITAHVQIEYMGSADDFAWIVPVPSVPDVAESSVEVFRQLDRATRMQVRLPPSEPCAVPTAADGTSSCGCGFAADEQAAFAPNAAPRDGGDVIVYASDYTENYEYVVVGAESTQVLVTWLQDNGYNVSDNMTPVMDVYNGVEGKFLAVKLRDGRQAEDIVPLRFTYLGDSPMIPLQLTRVAAQPSMGILIFIVADQAFESSNFDNLEPNPDQILFDGDGKTSYFEWVARSVAEKDGRAVVFETSIDNPLRNGTVDGQRIEGAVVTRLYTRMSPEHMLDDPVFVPSARPDNSGGVLDLSTQPTLWLCGGVLEPERLPSACAFNYCGPDSECTVVDGQVGCICPTDTVATTVTGPDGLPHVTCTPRDNPIGITGTAGGEGTEFDPCNGFECGDGTCVLKSGFPTCECGAGQVACLEPDGAVTCVTPAVTPETFGPGAGAESRGTLVAMLPNRRELRMGTGIWAAFAGLMLWRRHRRRRAAGVSAAS